MEKYTPMLSNSKYSFSHAPKIVKSEILHARQDMVKEIGIRENEEKKKNRKKNQKVCIGKAQHIWKNGDLGRGGRSRNETEMKKQNCLVCPVTKKASTGSEKPHFKQKVRILKCPS